MKVRILNTSGFPLPQYQTSGSAGVDLPAAISAEISLLPMERRLIPTGISLEIPQGFEAQIRPRSGTALKTGITMLNSPGTIDSDYRGEIKLIVINLSGETQTISPGERLAQMVFCRHEIAEWEETTDLEITSRGSGGFGHTGTQSPKI